MQTLKKYLKKNTLDFKIEDFDLTKDELLRGEDNLKAANVNKEYTELQLLEWIKCSRSVIYFCEKYIKIISVDDGVIPFRLYDYQRGLLEKYQNNRFILSLQCRQSGKCVTGDTLVDIRFLGVECTDVRVESVFKFSTIINKYKLLDFNGMLDDTIEQQIYIDLLQVDVEHETKFASIWRSSPRETKIAWWEQLTPKFSDDGFVGGILHQQPQDKKFVESHILDGLIEVKSDTGWVDVNEVHKTVEYKIWKLKTQSFNLDCADNHIVFSNGREVFTKDLVVGDMIDTENGPERVLEVYETDDVVNMYDLGVSHTNHRYYTNGILSHNTQTTAAFFLWFAIFHETKILGILANKYAQAQEIMDRIRLSYEYLPFFLQPGAKTYNKKTLVFSNESQIFCAATSSSSIRGRSLSLLYIDEAAFIRNCTEFYESTYPVIASGKESRVIMTTTPNGQRGMFYKLWVEAQAGNNEFITHMVYWHQVPGRDEAWKKQTVGNTSPAQFRQEFDLEFRGSQNTLISGATLDTIPVVEPIDSLGGVDVYQEAQKGHTYMITVDTARGIGGDYSAFVVIDITTTPYTVVAKYRDNTISPMLYPSVIYNTALQYNNAEVLVEINDNGEQTVMILYHDFEYEQVMSTYSDKNRQVLGMHHSAKLGVRTTVAVKAIGCSTLNTLLENSQLHINDDDILTELGTFVQKGRSFEADEGCHDDLVMCLVLFAWATRQQYFIGLTDIDVRNRIIDQMEHDAAAQLVPFGIIDNGVHDEPETYNNQYGISSVYGNGW